MKSNPEKESAESKPDATNKDEVMMGENNSEVKKKNKLLSEWLESLNFPEIKILAIIITKRSRYVFCRTPYQEITLAIPRHIEIDGDLLCRLPNVMV